MQDDATRRSERRADHIRRLSRPLMISVERRRATPASRPGPGSSASASMSGPAAATGRSQPSRGDRVATAPKHNTACDGSPAVFSGSMGYSRERAMGLEPTIFCVGRTNLSHNRSCQPRFIASEAVHVRGKSLFFFHSDKPRSSLVSAPGVNRTRTARMILDATECRNDVPLPQINDLASCVCPVNTHSLPALQAG